MSNSLSTIDTLSTDAVQVLVFDEVFVKIANNVRLTHLVCYCSTHLFTVYSVLVVPLGWLCGPPVVLRMLLQQKRYLECVNIPMRCHLTGSLTPLIKDTVYIRCTIRTSSPGSRRRWLVLKPEKINILFPSSIPVTNVMQFCHIW